MQLQPSPPETGEILAALKAIHAELRAARVPDDLWTKDEVAAYLKCKRSKLETLMQKPGFPRPVRLPTSDNGGHPLYPAKEIRAWAMKWRVEK